jgi:hypothetical protein
MVMDQNRKNGWALEATPETDPINAIDAKYWKWGVRTKQFKDLNPIETHNWEEIYYANKRNPSDMHLVSSSLSNAVAYFPVNLVPYYLIMGSCSTAAGVHTIDNINTGSLPTFTARTESTGGTVDKIFSAVGCKVQSLSGHIDFSKGTPLMSHTLSYNAIQNDSTPSYNDVHNGTKFPTDDGLMTGTETKGLFKYDTNFAFHWDSGGDNVDYSGELSFFNFLIINYHNIVGVENQTETEYIHEGNYSLGVSFALKRGADKSLYDDFLAKTQHNMYLTIYAGATNYRTLTWSNVAIGQCAAPDDLEKDASRIIWDAQGKAEDLTITGKDGVHTDFTGE